MGEWSKVVSIEAKLSKWIVISFAWTLYVGGDKMVSALVLVPFPSTFLSALIIVALRAYIY
jgi:hypothetical protein